MNNLLQQIRDNTQTIDMDAGNIDTALVKEHTAEMPRNLAICCESIRISMRGNSSYLLEKKDSTKKYKSVAVLKDRSIVIYVLYAKVAATKESWCNMILVDNEGEVLLLRLSTAL
jgi:hypothetical protein